MKVSAVVTEDVLEPGVQVENDWAGPHTCFYKPGRHCQPPGTLAVHASVQVHMHIKITVKRHTLSMCTVQLCAVALWHCQDVLNSIFWRLHNPYGKKASVNWHVLLHTRTNTDTHICRKDLEWVLSIKLSHAVIHMQISIDCIALAHILSLFQKIKRFVCCKTARLLRYARARVCICVCVVACPCFYSQRSRHSENLKPGWQ